jgi:hypothetical protein
MTRWIMLGLTLLGVVLVFTTKSVGVLSLGLLSGCIGFFGFILAMASDRVSASGRPESSMAAIDDLTALHKLPSAADAARASAVRKIAQSGSPADPGDTRAFMSPDQAAGNRAR